MERCCGHVVGLGGFDGRLMISQAAGDVADGYRSPPLAYLFIPFDTAVVGEGLVTVCRSRVCQMVVERRRYPDHLTTHWVMACSGEFIRATCYLS